MASALPWPVSVIVSLPPNVLGAAVIYAAGYGTGLLFFAWMARRRGLDTVGVRTVAFAGLVGGLFGANVTQLLFGGTPGRTILGGLAVGYLAVYLAKRRIGLRRPTGDLFAVALAAGEAVGRWGCFVGGCCYGRAVIAGSLPWAVWQEGAWRHPSQIYQSLASFGILGILLWRDRRRPALPENGLFYLQGALATLARFVIEYYRDGSAFFAGLTMAQWACLAGFVFFAIRYCLLVRRTREMPFVPLARNAAA